MAALRLVELVAQLAGQLAARLPVRGIASSTADVKKCGKEFSSKGSGPELYRRRPTARRTGVIARVGGTKPIRGETQGGPGGPAGTRGDDAPL